MANETDSGFHATVLIDVMPDHQTQGMSVLVDFVREARRDQTVRSIVLIQQASAPNHHIVDMTFPDQIAYRRFVQAPYVRSFRTMLFQHLGSPWDERLGSEVVV